MIEVRHCRNKNVNKLLSEWFISMGWKILNITINSTSVSDNNLEGFVCHAFFKTVIEVIPSNIEVSVVAIERDYYKVRWMRNFQNFQNLCLYYNMLWAKSESLRIVEKVLAYYGPNEKIKLMFQEIGCPPINLTRLTLNSAAPMLI